MKIAERREECEMTFVERREKRISRWRWLVPSCSGFDEGLEVVMTTE
jgi:hypothetical protein